MPDLPSQLVNDMVFDGQETPFQRGVRTSSYTPSVRPSIERFPYYTAFPYGWFAAGYSSEVGPGDVVSKHLLARDLVLWRTDDGTPVVMDAHCPHRGANMAIGGTVDGCNLVCPYHHWTWGPAGDNTSIPYRDETARNMNVRTYPTVETAGFVFFWYHPDPNQPALWQLPDLDEYLDAPWTEMRPYDVTYHCPWQEVAENYPDNLHLRVVHGAPFVPTVTELEFEGPFQTLTATYDMEIQGQVMACHMRTEAFGPGFSVMRSSNIVESVFFLATTPTNWESTTSRMGYQIQRVGDGPEARAYEQAILDALLAESTKQWAEDAAIFDNKVYTPQLGEAPEDQSTRRYRSWAQQFYVDGDPIAQNRL